MTTLRLVLHGKHAQNPAVRAAVAAERAAGHRVDVRVTWEGGDAARLAEEASRMGVERVAAGGDDERVPERAGAEQRLGAKLVGLLDEALDRACLRGSRAAGAAARDPAQIARR